jgi:hypothetical protein
MVVSCGGSSSLSGHDRLAVGCCGEALVFVSGVVLRHLGPSWCVNFELVFVLMVLCVVSVVIIVVTTSFLS